MVFSDKQLLIIVGVGAVGVFYAAYKAKEAAETVVAKINPVDPGNFLNTTVNDFLFPDGSDSLGTKFYDFINN